MKRLATEAAAEGISASDEVLGAIKSGVDFEKRTLAIYQQCRTPEEIDAAFRTPLADSFKGKSAGKARQACLSG